MTFIFLSPAYYANVPGVLCTLLMRNIFLNSLLSFTPKRSHFDSQRVYTIDKEMRLGLFHSAPIQPCQFLHLGTRLRPDTKG